MGEIIDLCGVRATQFLKRKLPEKKKVGQLFLGPLDGPELVLESATLSKGVSQRVRFDAASLSGTPPPRVALASQYFAWEIKLRQSCKMADKPDPSPDFSRKEVLKKRTDLCMNLLENRRASFERWPLTSSDCLCTPEKMAEAGFYFCATKEERDLVRCYVCFKEYMAWNPNEDPFQEHARSTNCAFVRMGKKAEELTVKDVLDLEKERAKNRARLLAEMYYAELDDAKRKVMEELDKLQHKKQ
ncbi:hypothetical protein HPB51_001837 [Rhipicephalus microplus]|uniref:Uncharacterized protein n=1 Tax=Rhipicephalus microplus TaxID=6941 RepID=A0A9J6EEQ5_RHIMP|nr:hypothetical protein HPB51_001837 [Rhipicephalus microplus]